MTAEDAYLEMRGRFERWPTIADVIPERNPLTALLVWVEMLDRPSQEADRYIQAMTNSTGLPLWRGGGKSLPVKKFRHYTSDLTAAMTLYTMLGGELPAQIPSTPLECTKHALRRLVERATTREL